MFPFDDYNDVVGVALTMNFLIGQFPLLVYSKGDERSHPLTVVFFIAAGYCVVLNVGCCSASSYRTVAGTAT